MKILLVNKYFNMHGGSETYFFGLADLLRQAGHEVIFFAMQDEKNLPCEQSAYFVSNVEFNGELTAAQKLKAAFRMVYSFEAKKKISALIEKEKPDIIHINLFHRVLTASIVDAAKKHGIPVVLTMHDLNCVCPNHVMLDHGKICEACLRGNYWNCVKRVCFKDSRAKCLMAAIESANGVLNAVEIAKASDRLIGIALGVVLGSISFWIPGVPQPVKLGLAGGPLIVAILIGRYGPYYRLITYTTMSANLMLREVGISLFLAGVGLGAGEDFVPTLVAGGYVWIAYGAVITIVPLLLAGLFGRFYYKLNYYTLIGVLSGASTNPPALAYSAEQTSSDAPSVGYATVYPLSMFLRVLAAQLLILIFG